MNGSKMRRFVFFLKIAAAVLEILSVVWLCIYTLHFYPKTIEVPTDNAVGAVVVGFAGGLALAIVFSIILLASVVIAVLICVAAALTFKEKKYFLPAENGLRRQKVGYTIAVDILLGIAAAGIILLCLNFGVKAIGMLLASIIATALAVVAVIVAEILHNKALRSARQSAEEGADSVGQS